MKCPKCGSERSSVVDSRGDAGSIRRRRECSACSFRYTTFERVEYSLPLVVKKDGRREAFKSSKLRSGILRACEKRPVSIEVVDRVVEAIEKKISELCLKEIPSRQIGDHIMDALRGVDKIAYVRFASVYREFSDVSQFVDTLKGLEEIKIAAEQSKKEKAALKDLEAGNSSAHTNVARANEEVEDKCSLE